MLKICVGIACAMAVIVVVAVAALFLGVSPRFVNHLERGKRSTAQSQIALFKQAMSQFYIDQAFYPDSLDALIHNPGDSRIANYPEGGYLDTVEIPKDPWGNTYVLTVPGTHGWDFDIESYGKDGLDGGEGDDADIESWRL